MTVALRNREQINDRGKLIFHRVVARRLKIEPSLLEKARVFLADACTKNPGRRDALSEWMPVLQNDVDFVRQVLVRRDVEMMRLRLSSPFALMGDFVIRDEDQRRKLWRIAKKTPTAQSKTSTVPSAR